MFSIIAAIGKNRELGNKGGLVFHLKGDMKFFRETTVSHSVVMGRRTWESLPKKLPGRKNIVVSRHEVEGADEVVKDLASFIEKYGENEEEIFVIGGGKIYEEFLPYAKNLYLTEVEAEREADTFFPEFDKSRYERIILGEGDEDDIHYVFLKYVKIEGES